MKRCLHYTLVLGVMTGLFSSCKKSDSTTDSSYKSDVTAQFVLNDFVTYVAKPQYSDFEAKALVLKNAVDKLNLETTSANLIVAQNAWYDVREIWEKSEAWLIGPVDTEGIDPSIDTWPMETDKLKALIESTDDISSTAVASFEDSFKGFHPLEYILFGENKSRVASELTPRQKEYMLSLAIVLYNNVKQLNASFSDSYAPNFTKIGVAGYSFSTEHDALTTLVSAMAGICDEVANGKMQDPIDEYKNNGKEPTLFEESQYAYTSLSDFKNNIVGVRSLYLGYYSSSNVGYSLRDLVRKEAGATLDNTIQNKMNEILLAFDNLGVNQSYGNAIKSNLAKVQNIQSLINQLRDLLETDVIAKYLDVTYKKK